jgi:hypothetical protein
VIADSSIELNNFEHTFNLDILIYILLFVFFFVFLALQPIVVVF